MAESPAPPSDLPIGQGYPARRRADPMMLSRGFDAAADVLLSQLKHTAEMESADLTVAGAQHDGLVASLRRTHDEADRRLGEAEPVDDLRLVRDLRPRVAAVVGALDDARTPGALSGGGSPQGLPRCRRQVPGLRLLGRS